MVRYSSLHFQLDELISISIFSDRFESRSVPFNLENTYIASIVKKGRIRPPWGQGFFKLHLDSLKKIYLSITFWLTLQLFWLVLLLVTQPMMQCWRNPTELRSMDSCIQILYRFQKSMRKLPPLYPLSTQKSPFTPQRKKMFMLV